MAFSHGKRGRIMAGKFDLSPFLKDFGGPMNEELPDVTTLTKNSKCVIPGQSDGKLSLSGFFDGSANAIDAILSAWRTDGRNGIAWPYLAAYAGYGTIGARVRLGHGYIQTYEVTGGSGSAVEVSGEVQSDGADEGGVLLADLAQRNADGNGTSVDEYGAATANGGIAVAHCTEFTGITGLVLKVQHSTDGSAWVDLVTFTTLVAAGSQLVEVPEGTTVNRYLRGFWDVTGTGTFTAAIAFGRR